MLRHTNAYAIWKGQSQQMLDFAVLVSTAAPQLEYAFKQHQANPATHLVKNPSFRPSNVPYATETRALPVYADVLGATVLLSVFAYFEVYFFSVIDEIISFHSGEAGLSTVILRQMRTKARPTETNNALNQLRSTFKANRSDRYRKYTAEIDDSEVVWPSQRFMLFGLKQAVRQRKRWRSADIPDLVTDLLTLSITVAERDKFHDLRDQRNKIAHGKTLKCDLKKAMSASNFLLDLSRKIDTHVVEHFLIIERFAH